MWCVFVCLWESERCQITLFSESKSSDNLSTMADLPPWSQTQIFLSLFKKINNTSVLFLTKSQKEVKEKRWVDAVVSVDVGVATVMTSAVMLLVSRARDGLFVVDYTVRNRDTRWCCFLPRWVVDTRLGEVKTDSPRSLSVTSARVLLCVGSCIFGDVEKEPCMCWKPTPYKVTSRFEMWSKNKSHTLCSL